ncbi:YihY family inner membrane protein [bacterium]|nr:YihY family inner membrane protein [bacterium]
MAFSKAWPVLKASFKEWREDDTNQLAAALSYYTAVSIAPLLIFVLLLMGLFMGGGQASDQLVSQLQAVFGEEGSAFIQTIVDNADQPTVGSIAGILSLLTLIWGSTNVFAHLQKALNAVWDVKVKPDAGIKQTLRKRLLTFTMVLGIGFLLAVSLVLSSALSVLTNTLSGALPGTDLLWQVLDFVISVGVLTLLFAAIYKILPDVEIKWRDVWLGALLTALLFTIGKLLLGIYFGRAGIGSTYGAAGSVIIFLLWVYYSSMILFFGAEMTQVYARRYGSGIQPSAHAVRMERKSNMAQAD